MKKKTLLLKLNPKRPTHQRVISILAEAKKDLGMTDYVIGAILNFDDQRNGKTNN